MTSVKIKQFIDGLFPIVKSQIGDIMNSKNKTEIQEKLNNFIVHYDRSVPVDPVFDIGPSDSPENNAVVQSIESVFDNIWSSQLGFTKGYPIVTQHVNYKLEDVKAGDYIEYKWDDVKLPAVVYKDDDSDILLFQKMEVNTGDSDGKYKYTISPRAVNEFINDITKVQRKKTIAKSKTVWAAGIISVIAIIDPIMGMIASPEILELLGKYNFPIIVQGIGILVIFYERIKKLVKYDA